MRFSLKNDMININNESRSRSIHMASRIPLFAALLLITIPMASGKDFWETKEYKKWSQKECLKMLQDSPWAKSYKVTQSGMMSRGADATGEDPFIEYLIRLRSASPIRHATVRLTQIANKYDEMSPEQKQQLDKSSEAFLSADYSDMIVIHVEYETNMNSEAANLSRYWQTKTTEMLRNSTFLIGSKDVKIPLLQFIAGQGEKREFQFIFPRQSEGKPVLTPGDKSLKLEFEYPAIGGQSGGQAFIEFKVPKMLIGEEVIY